MIRGFEMGEDIKELPSEQSKIYYPSEDVVNNANVKEYEKMYEYSINNLEDFFCWACSAESNLTRNMDSAVAS